MSEVKETKVYLNGHEVKGWDEEPRLSFPVIISPVLGTMHIQGRTTDGRPFDEDWQITWVEAARVKADITAKLEHGVEPITVTIGPFEIPFKIGGAKKMLEYMIELLDARED